MELLLRLTLFLHCSFFAAAEGKPISSFESHSGPIVLKVMHYFNIPLGVLTCRRPLDVDILDIDFILLILPTPMHSFPDFLYLQFANFPPFSPFFNTLAGSSFIH